MCYSAKIQADYRQYVRLYGADVDLDEFARLYRTRAESDDVKIPKAMDAAFLAESGSGAHDIAAAIARFTVRRQTELEADLFAQRARQAAAERKLQTKITKTASNELRIATDKVATNLRALEDLRRTELAERDFRIYPAWYAPVLIQRNDRRRWYRCAIGAAFQVGPSKTSAKKRVPTTRAPTACGPSGAACLVSPTASYSSMRSSRTSGVTARMSCFGSIPRLRNR